MYFDLLFTEVIIWYMNALSLNQDATLFIRTTEVPIKLFITRNLTPCALLILITTELANDRAV